MHPSYFGKHTPDTVCAVFSHDGSTLTYGELERSANQGARLLRSLGLREGSSLVFCLENDQSFLTVALAAQRIGLYFTPVSTRVTAEELAYIVSDSKADVLVLSGEKAEALQGLDTLVERSVHRVACGRDVAGYLNWERAAQSFKTDALTDPVCGEVLLYSSGTTGKPKGIKRPVASRAYDAADPRIARLGERCNRDTVFLSTSPLYHSAPYRYACAVLATGGKLVVMPRFDPEAALQLIGQYRCTDSLWVPTMFARLLRLPEDVRRRFDLSSMRLAVHGAAACPVHVKEAMIAWWGPILYEVYAGTEGVGQCGIDSAEWITHKGSVGRPLDPAARILDDNWQELEAGQVGTIYFEGTGNFSYHGDQAKTDAATSPQGWRTYGDVGYLDSDGYLYLTGRKSFTIITGGVNVYPQEVEDVLAMHPAVADCAVFGVPDDDMGEQVKAVVQAVDPQDAGPTLAQELVQWCRGKLSGIKCPRTIDFDAELPREPNGKLYKLRLQQRYGKH
ncbi:hypothetical protein BJN34_33030 [Cupriavidus necator]|uniref:Acyl-CoA synthetase n=1 Tax=Cupriavidus necator TaxID=106590 RepID=A0A1U9V153_CUPNE|nr:AMP-binding protein [Cupriavidus necator]AQV98704.1 hypothetical protein BJN34_33030 [Cupriavidus necator]